MNDFLVNLTEILEARDVKFCREELASIIFVACEFLLKRRSPIGLFNPESIFITRYGSIEVIFTMED